MHVPLTADAPLLLLLLLQLSDYKAGSCRADLEESRAAARAQQGLEPDSDEVRGWIPTQLA